MTDEHRQIAARNGFRGNIIVSTRAALRAQRFVMLTEKLGCKHKARARLGIPERTANRYLERWGR